MHVEEEEGTPFSRLNHLSHCIHMYQKMMCKFLLAISTYKYVSVNTIAFLIRFDGLYGAIIIYKPGSLDTNGKAKSVDKEFVTTLIGKYIV